MRICAYGWPRHKVQDGGQPLAARNDVRVRLPGNDETDQQSSNHYIFHQREINKIGEIVKTVATCIIQKMFSKPYQPCSALMIQFLG